MSGLFEGYRIESPPFDQADGRELAAQLFGREGDAVELGSHQDRNFLITAAGGERSVLKIANPHFGRASLEMQNAAMHHLAGAALDFATPMPIPATDGCEIATVTRGGTSYDVRMTSWVEGQPLTDARHLDRSVREAVGRMAAQTARALEGFDHPADGRVLQWDTKHARDVVDGLIRHLDDPERRSLVERAITEHDQALARLGGVLRMQVIHGDVTDFNTVCRHDASGRLVPCGLIDLGDMTRTYLAGEAAVAAASLVWHEPARALQGIAAVVSAFHAELPLTEDELAAVFPLVLARCAACAVSTSQQAEVDPDNIYANDLIDIDWSNLEAAAAIPPGLAHATIRTACGLPAHPASEALRRHLGEVRRCAPIDLGERAAVVVDLSVASPAYAHGEWESPDGVAACVAVGEGELAVGRYGEARLHRAGRPGAEAPGAIHLGVDVFASVGEHVRSPLDASVVGTADNTVALEAVLPGGERFRVLLDGVEPRPLGDAVSAGDVVGEVARRGSGMPPHLHVQIALDAFDAVTAWATEDLRDAWAGICPDPTALAGLDVTATAPPAADVHGLRKRVLADAQRLYYRDPPQIVRGWRHHLYDGAARPYLDMVNNVAVLGHSHPAVAEAANRALRLLNTNSRFLYDSMPRFAERLVELLPAPLDRVFLVSTGSEANDLALRLARAYTGREPVIAVAGAYHGWTTATYAVGTSLFDNPAAAASPPPGLRVVPQANAYRGEHRFDGPDAAERYAGFVRDAAPGAAAFICEPVLGNAGGVIPPDGYLRQAFAHVRAAGGVCIADEVQVGYGRLGEWFWAFEQQDAVPDIVTIAKATGNGHPVGAVITTEEIAESLHREAGFFSSVGGSPLSCEIGIAVLDAIRDERLQANAAVVGAHLRDGLEQLAGRHELIGAVHGRGLYLGVELVRDRESREPATEEAYALCERMRELGVIVQPTGDHENVLKVKPPLCMDRESADLFVETLDRVLGDGW
jgi:4-aminobutyrate aminotransferase-like enzyme/Ser/Thr protein kinase RdoA (MazF antagonist)